MNLGVNLLQQSKEFVTYIPRIAQDIIHIPIEIYVIVFIYISTIIKIVLPSVESHGEHLTIISA